MTRLIYAGIGARTTPPEILKQMTDYAKEMKGLGWTLRSGGAKGADQAFEAGAGKSKEIFYANDATSEAIELAAKHHPNWKACSTYAKKLHGRNCQIILGRDLQSPVVKVVCWTPGAKTEGGTGMAIRLAKSYGINVVNLAN